MKVCIFVANGYIADSRVLRQGETFARAAAARLGCQGERARLPAVAEGRAGI